MNVYMVGQDFCFTNDFSNFLWGFSLHSLSRNYQDASREFGSVRRPKEEDCLFVCSFDLMFW